MKIFLYQNNGSRQRGLPRHLSNEAGQTLIETLAALFILVMGMSAAVGLAIYAFNSSTSIVKKIVATGLAREGLEAIKNMRDTNWLKQATIDTDCYNFNDGTNTAQCYKSWLGDAAGTVPFCLNPTAGTGACIGDIVEYNNILHFDSSSPNLWLKYREALVGANYGLAFDPDGGNEGFYTTGTTGLPCQDGATENGFSISDYCRQITISKTTTAPYDQPNLQLVKVQSLVWWVDKKCPRAPDFDSAPSACKIELDTYLTNWKDYQN